MTTKYLDSSGLAYFWGKLKDKFQDKLVSGTNIKTINSESVLGSGNITIQGGGDSKNIWYATSTTGESTDAKVATTNSADFVLETGSMVRVLFENANSYNGKATLNVDGTGAKNIVRAGATLASRYWWTENEVVDFVYDGANWRLVNKGTATTTYYGLTKLSNSTQSDSNSLAATPSAVKAAYNLANDATATPTASTKSKFDTDGHMNSTDMSDSDVSDFVDGLNVSGGGVITQSFTPTAGSNYSGYGNCYYETMGKLVHIHIGVQGLTANSTQTIYTMPSGLRPPTMLKYLGGGGQTVSIAYITIGADGVVSVNSPQQYAIGELWYFAA